MALYINQTKVEINHFPDGTQLLNGSFTPCEIYYNGEPIIRFIWIYEKEEELITLYYLKRHVDTHYPNIIKYLGMPYIPNARMDRVHDSKDVFTLKWFAEIINSLKFDKVIVSDPHSNVSMALIDNAFDTCDVSKMLDDVLISISFGIWGNTNNINDIVLYFPDDGAYKRYSGLEIFKKRDVSKNIVIGHKERDWNTGKITGLKINWLDGSSVNSDETKAKPVLMVDDIISYGGTMAYSADELKRVGFGDIFAMATHIEASIINEEKGTLLKRVKDGVVKKVYGNYFIGGEYNDEYSPWLNILKNVD